MIKVLDPGLFTTVQDLGRFGFGIYGVPQSGAVDDFAYMLGNILVGNFENEAALEFTQYPGAYQFTSEATICLAGADFHYRINNSDIKILHTYHVRPGDILTGRYPDKGLRGYLCVRGGIDVPVVMGSRATYVRGRFGGFMGRKLEKGDLLKIGNKKNVVVANLSLRPEIMSYVESSAAGVIVINEIESRFLFDCEYLVSAQSDRMGIRLTTESPPVTGVMDIVTEPTPVGTIQITSSGLPIVLMNDCQTTGGYKIAGYVAPTELKILAQKVPGHRITFYPMSIEEAKKRLEERRSFFDSLKLIARSVYED